MFIVIGLVGLVGAPFAGVYLGGQFTAQGVFVVSLALMALIILLGRKSTFDTPGGPEIWSLCMSCLWLFIWMAGSFVHNNRNLIDPHTNSIRDFFIK